MRKKSEIKQIILQLKFTISYILIFKNFCASYIYLNRIYKFQTSSKNINFETWKKKKIGQKWI